MKIESPNKPDRANRRQPLDLGETVGEVRITDCPAAVAHPERSARLMNANGVPSSSPGLRRQALPWVIRSILSSTPSGLHHGRQIGADGTPLGFGAIWGRLPRVGALSSRQPWAEGWNAFGVRGAWCFSSVPMPAAEQACCRQRRDCAPVSNQTLLVRRALARALALRCA